MWTLRNRYVWLACLIAAPLRGRAIGVVVAVATFVAIAVLRWPLGPVLLVAAAASTLLAWRSQP